MKLDPLVIKAIGRNPLYEIGFVNTQTDGIFYIIISLFISLMFLIAIFNLMAALNYKFGKKIWILYLGIVVLANYLVESQVNIGLGQYFRDFAMNERITLVSTLKYVVFTGLCYLGTYAIVQSTESRWKKGRTPRECCLFLIFLSQFHNLKSYQNYRLLLWSRLWHQSPNPQDFLYRQELNKHKSSYFLLN